MSEIIDIRNELVEPLRHFRAAVLETAKEMDSEAYDADFAAHVDDIWISRVEPQLDAIRQAVRSNRYLWRLTGLSTQPEGLLSLGAAGLGVTLGLGGTLGAAEAGALALAAGVQAAGSAGVAWRDGRREVEQRQFWFLYEVNRRLSAG